jgi:hypothetical protein
MPGKVSELSLGYGGGWKAYKRMLFAQAGMHVTQNESQHVVDVYRNSHKKVKSLWYEGDNVLEALIRKQTFTFGRFGCLDGSNPEEGIGLPNGSYLRFPGLVMTMTDKGERKILYMHKRKATEIYGAMLVALCMQALARIVMTDAMLRIARRYRVVLTLHDELVIVAPKADIQEAIDFMHKEMTVVPDWLEGFPIACDVGYGENYGACK